jgi:hypothetical protein
MALGPQRAKPKVALNEQLKLIANQLDRLATVCMTVGFIGPLAKSISDPAIGFDGAIALSKLAFLYLATAAVLHFVAYLTLGNMQP